MGEGQISRSLHIHWSEVTHARTHAISSPFWFSFPFLSFPFLPYSPPLCLPSMFSRSFLGLSFPFSSLQSGTLVLLLMVAAVAAYLLSFTLLLFLYLYFLHQIFFLSLSLSHSHSLSLFLSLPSRASSAPRLPLCLSKSQSSSLVPTFYGHSSFFFLTHLWAIFSPPFETAYWTALVALCHFAREFMCLFLFFPPSFCYAFQLFQSRWRTSLTKGL